MKRGSKSLGPPDVDPSYTFSGEGVLALIGQGKLYIKTELDLAFPLMDEVNSHILIIQNLKKN